ncbi:hypothetical protein [Solwaraspora sp. WMMD792]|uniref:hypothetical protein n=1 Tax=Solwaraspora sp. WMMD792 TaxID=3016099 RepID=UPI002416796F|nr:hypothetical protein [Solwaraspora sp. WMMD792]MDG4768751.1 hypothetical protein [Solwaraspora sp. WMMD792]MDG4768790.1 hypothetical protein [Solwaraspora sp. WMMD792]MDG4768830.1 hypothetical protein [Solwaraspora sp. WMMD792]MDG4768854.1 hypothetical protein [Solwaraspora sp. WMMD792]MDG4768887.1 hypothetical protein [Solwaraspora sp. WMMD792]
MTAGTPGWPRRAATRAPAPPAELAGAAGARAQVWIAVARAGVTAHKIRPTTDDKQRRTVCGRFVSSAEREQGQVLAAAVVAERYRAAWCPHCWPSPQTQTEVSR